ncbi:hypothetical protein GCM10027413_17610 [Conyzicola nivalis]|uniref:Uncharacterized protein n=1 Tax=Conyzicola nivalis TaxID=1477021 RepID=A0A916SHQ2_9MICO|nr:hypothetical protein GCM10010979_09010 [Conyzicola nivalis]
MPGVRKPAALASQAPRHPKICLSCEKERRSVFVLQDDSPAGPSHPCICGGGSAVAGDRSGIVNTRLRNSGGKSGADARGAETRGPRVPGAAASENLPELREGATARRPG